MLVSLAAAPSRIRRAQTAGLEGGRQRGCILLRDPLPVDGFGNCLPLVGLIALPIEITFLAGNAFLVLTSFDAPLALVDALVHGGPLAVGLDGAMKYMSSDMAV